MKTLFVCLLVCVPVSGVFAEWVPAWAGVETRVLEAGEREGLPVPAGAGLVVAALPGEGPVAGALAAGDVLVEFAGQLLVHPQQLGVLVALNEEAEAVGVKAVRGGAVVDMSLPMKWEKVEPVIAIPDIPRERALPEGGADVLERERALLEAIRRRADEQLSFEGILTGSAVRRDAEGADE